MKNTCAIITGTSRGIGEATAMLLLEHGATVIGLARGDAKALQDHPKYTHIQCDLADTDRIDQVMKDIVGKLSDRSFKNLYLLNNAAIVEPFKPIEACTANEITKNITINLIAPMVLTSCFIKQTAGMGLKRKILNISSGSGTYPLPHMSVYCTSKAGINMFTRSVGLEQANAADPVEILAVDPGMVETELQRTARELPDFAMGDYFRKSFEEGKLMTTGEIAQHIMAVLEADLGSGKVVQYFDR